MTCLKVGFHVIAAIAAIATIVACDRCNNVERSLRLQVSIWSLRSLQNKDNAREDLEQTATYCILVYFSSQRSLQSLEDGFHMIPTIATIGEIELKSISAIVVAKIAMIATIAEVVSTWPQRSLNFFFSNRGDRSDHKETSLYPFKIYYRTSSIHCIFCEMEGHTMSAKNFKSCMIQWSFQTNICQTICPMSGCKF